MVKYRLPKDVVIFVVSLNLKCKIDIKIVENN